MALALDGLLIQQDKHWSAILPLTAPQGAGINASRIRAALSAAALPDVLLVDMKAESDQLYPATSMKPSCCR